MSAPVAIQQGRHAARNILPSHRWPAERGLSLLGQGQPCNHRAGHKPWLIWVACKSQGLIAWLAWLFVHVLFLIGFRIRFVVIFEWAWAYLTYQRGARLITGDIEKIVQNRL